MIARIQARAGDPADRLIYATAIERGLNLVTKDRAIRDHDGPRPIAIWESVHFLIGPIGLIRL